MDHLAKLHPIVRELVTDEKLPNDFPTEIIEGNDEWLVLLLMNVLLFSHLIS